MARPGLELGPPLWEGDDKPPELWHGLLMRITPQQEYVSKKFKTK
jgi:hypothetical protein